MSVRCSRVKRGRQQRRRAHVVTFVCYDLGYFDDETCRLEPIDSPFDPKVLPMMRYRRPHDGSIDHAVSTLTAPRVEGGRDAD